MCWAPAVAGVDVFTILDVEVVLDKLLEGVSPNRPTLCDCWFHQPRYHGLWLHIVLVVAPRLLTSLPHSLWIAEKVLALSYALLVCAGRPRRGPRER